MKRSLGICPVYCRGCLHVTKACVTGSASETERLWECPLCGSTGQALVDGVFVDRDMAKQASIQDLIRECRIDVSPEVLRLWQGESREWSDAQRESHIFATFCENQASVLARLRNELVGRLLMFWLVFPLLVFPFVDGEITYDRVIFIESVLVVAGGYQLMHALAARKIRPRLRQLLRACHRDMDYLQNWIKTSSPRYRALRRHLASWRYNALRRESRGVTDYAEPVCERMAIGGFWIN